jgi:hypothetical protein
VVVLVVVVVTGGGGGGGGGGVLRLTVSTELVTLHIYQTYTSTSAPLLNFQALTSCE